MVRKEAGRSGASCPRIRCLHKRACYESQFPDVKGLVNPIYKNSIFLDNIKRISNGFIIKREQAHTICNTNNGL